MNLSQRDIRMMIYYCWKRNLNPPAICKEMNAALGSGAVIESTCRRWVTRFNNGNFNVEDI